jgi:hypothetical protein
VAPQVIEANVFEGEAELCSKALARPGFTGEKGANVEQWDHPVHHVRRGNSRGCS